MALRSALWAGLLAWGGVAFAAAELQEVPLATGEWPPYMMQKAPGGGLFTRLVEEAFRRAGLKPVYHFAGTRRAEAMVEQGLVLAAFPYAINDERLKRFDFSEPILMSNWKLFYYRSEQQETERFDRLSDFAGRRVATSRGYWYEDLLRQYGAQIVYTSDDPSSFRLLTVGRAETVVQDELVGWYLIGQHFPEHRSRFATFDMHVGERSQQALHLLISRRYPNAGVLKARLDVAIKAVRSSGLTERLVNNLRSGVVNARDEAAPLHSSRIKQHAEKPAP